MITDLGRIELWSANRGNKNSPIPLTRYEIWLGYYHLGQGYDPPTAPDKVAEIEATSFRVACYLYELDNISKSIRDRMKLYSETGNPNYGYIEDIHFGNLYYNAKDNSNDWTGKYYQTEEEAWKFFKR